MLSISGRLSSSGLRPPSTHAGRLVIGIPLMLPLPRQDDSAKYRQEDVPATIRAILTPSGYVDSTAGTEGPAGLVLDITSFYAESGGQVGDTGVVEVEGGAGSVVVTDCQVAAGYVLHVGEVQGTLAVGQSVKVRVDYERRMLIRPNHTLTHVLNYALR